MSFPWAAAGSLASGAMAMSSSRRASKEQRKMQQIALSNAGQAFTPIDVYGPGGAGVQYNVPMQQSNPFAGMDLSQLGSLFSGLGGNAGGEVGIGGWQVGPTQYSPTSGSSNGIEVVEGTRGRVRRSNINNAVVNVGDLDPIRQMLVAGAANLTGQAGLTQDTMGRIQDLEDAAGIFGQAGLGRLGQLQNSAGLAQGLATVGLADASDFATQLREQAQGAFGALAGTQQEARDNTLALLREQARLPEERAFSRLQDNLFATGRMGSSGGGLQMEAFARGLGQADLQRQLVAAEEGRAAQQAQLGLGQGLASQQDAMMANAMNRFGSMTQLNNQLGQTRFDRTTSMADENFARMAALLNVNPQAMQSQMLAGQLGNLAAMLNAVGGINQTGYNAANFSQTLMANQAAARGGQQQVLSGMMQPNFGEANMWAQMSQALNPGGNALGQLGSWVGGLFNRGNNSSSLPVMTSSDVTNALANDPMFGP